MRKVNKVDLKYMTHDLRTKKNGHNNTEATDAKVTQ